MKHLVHVLALSVLVLFAGVIHAAEDFTIWSNSTFTGPYTNGVIAVSDTISNANSLSSARIVFKYETLVPDGASAAASYAIQAVIEEEVATGVWSPIAYQFKGINDSTSAPQRIVTMSPGLIIDIGQDNVIYASGKELARVSTSQVNLPDAFRVKLMVDNQGSYPLTSVTISAYGRKYDE